MPGVCDRVPTGLVCSAEFESKDRSACDPETTNIVIKRGEKPRHINTEHDHEHHN
jgi:hypothetical protein